MVDNRHYGHTDRNTHAQTDDMKTYYLRSGADTGFAKGRRTMASAELEPITGIWDWSPSRVQGQSPWWGSVGRSLLEAESFLSIFIQKRGQKVRI